MSSIRLSFCIPTYNFGQFIGATLDSIIDQANARIEIVVLDGGSTDSTPEVVAAKQKRFSRLRYHRLDSRGGIDRDIERVVALAEGDFCWLLSSDDVLVPGAVATMLAELETGHTVYLCNRHECDRDLRPVQFRPWLSKQQGSRTFTPSTREAQLEYFGLAASVGALFSYMSSIVVQRERWARAETNDAMLGSHYSHAYRLLKLLISGGALRYIRDPLVLCRGDNDSFRQRGLAARYMLDFAGYYDIGQRLFNDPSVRRSFYAVVRAEHAWYVFTEIRSRLSANEWSEFERWLVRFNYAPWQLRVIRRIGSMSAPMALARALWRARKRLRRP